MARPHMNTRRSPYVSVDAHRSETHRAAALPYTLAAPRILYCCCILGRTPRSSTRLRYTKPAMRVDATRHVPATGQAQWEARAREHSAAPRKPPFGAQSRIYVVQRALRRLKQQHQRTRRIEPDAACSSLLIGLSS